MEQPLPANHASNKQPGTTCENSVLRIAILSTIKSQPSTFLIWQAVQPSFREMILSAKHGFNRKPHCNGIWGCSGGLCPPQNNRRTKPMPLTANLLRGFVFAKNSPRLTMPVNLHG